jgi:hypothetical protein
LAGIRNISGAPYFIVSGSQSEGVFTAGFHVIPEETVRLGKDIGLGPDQIVDRVIDELFTCLTA